MLYRIVVSSTFVALAFPVLAQGQIGPSVLDLQTSYHVGVYGASIDVPSGAYLLLAQQGTFDMVSGGGFSGVLDTWEWTSAGGAFTPNDPVAGTYHVSPEGFIEFDFDPQNPGTDVFEMVIDTDGSTAHVARYELEPEAVSVLALEKSTGQTNAALSGVYHFYGQRMEFAGSLIETTSERGTATFDGAGGLTFTGTELFVMSNGTTSTSPISGSATYSVAADGELTLAGSPGGMLQGGEVFFVITGSLTSSEVGMMIAVRVGASYDLNDLAGRYGLHGQTHELGTAPGNPRTITDLAELRLTATTPTTGAWAIDGLTVHGNASAQLVVPFIGAGTMTLAGNGVLTIQDPGGDLELAFSDSGKFAAGRVIENDTNLWFAMRACPRNYDFGTATAGSGGIEPELGMRTFPTLGNSAWRYAITDGLGGAPAILAIGFFPSSAGVPLSGGLLWLDPLAIVANPFLILGGAPGVAGDGSLDVPLAIPTDPSYGGVKLFAQAFMLDPGAPQNVAMTRGFAVEFCR